MEILTVTGKTLAENLAIVPDLNDGQEVIHEIQKQKPQEIFKFYSET
jgi:hypothetical protein